MKFSIVLALVAAATVVSAESNAQRFARGLGPNTPAKRASPVEFARRHKPSGTPPGQCNTGKVQCCNQSGTAGEDDTLDDYVNSIVGSQLAPGTKFGVGCSAIAGKGAKCDQQPVCCENNHFSGIVAIGCTPIDINL